MNLKKVKIMEKKYLGLIILIIGIITLYFAFSYGYLDLQFSGSQNSDLLVITSGNIKFIEGQNQQLTGDYDSYVSISGIVGLGNDVASIGSVDTETMEANGYSKSADFSLSAKKVKMNTEYSLTGTTNTVKELRDRIYNVKGSEYSYSIGTLIQSNTEENQALVSAGAEAVSACKLQHGSNYATTAWRPVVSGDIGFNGSSIISHSICFNDITAGFTGVCLGGWKPTVIFECFAFTDNQVEFTDIGSGFVDAQIDLQLYSAKSGNSSILSLTSQNPSGLMYDNGDVVGWASITEIASGFDLPIDFQQEVFAKTNITPYNQYNIARDSDTRDVLNLRNALQTASTSSSSGNIANIESLVNQYNNAFNSMKSNFQNKIDNKFAFTFNPINNRIIIDDSTIRNGEIVAYIKGNWLGLIRDEADFKLTCGNSINTIEQNTEYSSVKVQNISTVSGSGNLSWNCPVSVGSKSVSLGAGQSQTFNVDFYSPSETQGNCTFNFSYSGQNESCLIGYDFDPKPATCGNGVIDAGEECDGVNFNNQTCISKGFDSGSLSCSNTCTISTQSCELIIPREVCGDGIDNDNDGFVDSADSDCQSEFPFELLLLGGILLIVIIIGGVIIYVLLSDKK